MVQKGLSRAAENSGKFRPGIRGAHIDSSDRFNPGFGWVNPKQARGLAALDATPELALSRDDEVLIKRIGMGSDLDPFAAPRDRRENSTSGAHHPHIMLQLRQIFAGGRFLRERPRQHELGLEYGIASLNPPIE